MTIEEIEQKELEDLRKSRPDWIGTDLDRPFGMVYDEWSKWKLQIVSDDTIEEYDDGGWDQLAGRSGYCIRRNGQVISRFCTLMS